MAMRSSVLSTLFFCLFANLTLSQSQRKQDRLLFNPLDWPPPPPTKDVLQMAEEWGATTYVEYVRKSGLDKTLYNGPGPFTIFAPFNDAFENLDPEFSHQLETNKTFLRELLRYHTVNARVVDDDLRVNDRLFPTMLNGTNIRSALYIEGTKVGVWTVSGVMMQYGDVNATNGILQGLMGIMYPIPTLTIYEYLQKDVNFTFIKKVIDVAGLDAMFRGGAYTLFAPVDKVFEDLPKKQIDAILSNPSYAKRLVYNHMINGTVYSVGFFNEKPIPNMNGKDLDFYTDYREDELTVNGTMFIQRDLQVTTGVIHAIDGILFP